MRQSDPGDGYLPLPELVLLPLAFELLPLVSLLEPVDPVAPDDEPGLPMPDEPDPEEPDPDEPDPDEPDPDEPELPMLDEPEPDEPVPDEPLVPELVPEEDSPDPAEVSELPEPSVLVPPEAERDVLPLRPCERELFPEVLEPLLLWSADEDGVSDDVPALLLPVDPCVDPCEAESDPVVALDCPLDPPVPVLDPLDCANAVPASARTAAAPSVPTQ